MVAIEVIGLPGVGKTTLIRKYLPHILDGHRVIETRFPTMWTRIYAKFLYILYYRARIKDKNLAKKFSYRHSFRPFFNLKRCFFFDAGMMQVILENIIENDCENTDSRIEMMKSVPSPDILIVIEDDIDAVIGREMARLPRRFEMDLDNLKKRYTTAQEIVNSKFLKSAQHVFHVNVNDDQAFKDALNIKD